MSIRLDISLNIYLCHCAKFSLGNVDGVVLSAEVGHNDLMKDERHGEHCDKDCNENIEEIASFSNKTIGISDVDVTNEKSSTMEDWHVDPEDHPGCNVMLAVLHCQRTLRMFGVEVGETNIEVIVNHWEAHNNLSAIADNEEHVKDVEMSDDKAEIDGNGESNGNTKEGRNVHQDKKLL